MKSLSKLFIVIYLPVAFVLLIAFFLLTQSVEDGARSELLNDMRARWHILMSQPLPDNFDAEYHDFIKSISDKTSMRITIIRKNGVVESDSFVDFDKISEMENHRGRPEIKHAFQYEEGFSSRYSVTLDMDMLYFCRKYSEDYAIRLAFPLTYVKEIRGLFTDKLITILIFLFVVIGVISIFFARRVSFPIQKLDFIAGAIEKEDDNILFPEFRDPTMSRVSGVIYRIYNKMKERQVELQKEQKKLNHILEKLKEGILLVDENKILLHYNTRAAELLDMSLKSGLHLLTEITDIHVLTFFNRIFGCQETVMEKLELFNAVFEVTKIKTGNVLLIVLRDVTEKDKYTRYKTNLISNVSHELKTPIASIMGYAETLLSHDDIDKKTSDNFLNTIYRTSTRLNDMINDIVELHKLEEMDMEMIPVEVVDTALLKDDLNNMYSVDDKGKIIILGTPCKVRINYEHLMSVMTNLIDNGFKYSESSEINVHIEKNDALLTITVDDYGPAIPREFRGRIFERFFTVSESRHKSRSGTGLGLSIVKHISEKYSGSVTVEDNELGGNRFTVILKEK